MPHWGRPSAARQGRRRKGWDTYARQKENWRFEDIDSDTDNSDSVGLEGSFVSDELHFTGADIGDRGRHRRAITHDYSSDSSVNDPDEESEAMTQLALRDKEDMLVQKALERIRRAQMMGKSNVKLSQRELDALERKQQRNRSKRKPPRSDSKLAGRRRSSGATVPVLKEEKSRKRIKGVASAHDEGRSSSPASPPGMLVPGHDGPSNIPLGYYPVTTRAQGRHWGQASPRFLSQQQSSPPLAQHSRSRGQQNRQSPSSTTPSQPTPVSGTPSLHRSLPDDPAWIPRPRSASSNLPYPLDPYQYQQHSPPHPQGPGQYVANRRIVSGPPDVHYPDIQYMGTRRVVALAQPSAASSEPSLLRRESSSRRLDQGTYSEEDSDSEGNGVQVNVVPYERGYSANP
ncbi:MAG: hypothetical protein Q9191_001081 [Dirinaria sp. TL-2023a]